VKNVLVIVSQTLSCPVIINTNRHYDYDIFNRQINIHLEVRHKLKSLVSNDVIIHSWYECLIISKFGSRIAGPSKQ
jgi:hypothetical protein